MSEPGVTNDTPPPAPAAEAPAPNLSLEAPPADAPPSAVAVTPVTEPAPPPETPADSAEAPRRSRTRWPSRSRRGETLIAPSPLIPAAPPAETAPPVAAVVTAPTASFAPPTADAAAPAPLAVPATAPAVPPVAVPAPNGPPESLDERLRRLETVLGKLAESPPAAQQVTPRPPAPVPAPPGGRRWMPRLLTTLFAAAAEPSVFSQPEARSPWLLFDIVVELRSMLHMFGDPRYRLTWPGRLVPAIMLVLIFTTTFWLPGSSTLPFLEKGVVLILAYFLFKTLSREARRYRETIPQTPPHHL